MPIRVRHLACSVVAGVVLLTGLASAQTTTDGRATSAQSVARYGLSELMPVDPEAALGTLPNGLKYYVRANNKPQRRAELRLVVKAGSVLEDDDQQGLAHFVEHMEFEGTRRFPRQRLMDFLGALGLSIGPDANAETSYDQTEYTLRVPTDAPGALDRALMIINDWAQGATFDQEGIDHEREIVLSEWRLHLGAGERTDEKIRNVQLQGSRYAIRAPIGKPENIQNATREQLVRFYRDWYRPDLMAVIAVGDFDRDAVVASIKEQFASLANPSPERPRPNYDVPDHPNPRYAIITDKETTNTTVEVSDLLPARNQSTVGGYRDIMLDQLFSALFGSRLNEISQAANAPFIRAVAGRSLFSAPRTRDEAVMQALVANNGVERGLDALVTELERISRFGFTETELTREKQAMMVSYERAVTESPDRESSSRADEYTRNFLEGEALPTIWQELAFHRRFLPEIRLAEINAITKDWVAGRNRTIVVNAPDIAGAMLPDEMMLGSVLRATRTKRLTPYVDTAGTAMLMDAPPSPRGSIVKTTPRGSGVTEWTLSNGATVVLKPTMLKEDQILFRAVAPGGTSLASDADFIPARSAEIVVPAGGVGKFNAVTLDKILSGKSAAAVPFIDEIEQGINGGSTPQDLETMFQLIYLRFTAPRADPVAFGVMQTQFKSLLANQQASPDVVFNQAVDAAVSQNHPRRMPDTPASIDKWNLDTSMAFYKARFADASNFTFVFVGSFTPEMIRPFVETYIATLPATHAHETWRDVGVTPPATVVDKAIEKGLAPKSEVAIVFTGPFQYDDAHRLSLRALTLLLQSRLFDTIRQELGGTYSITAVQDTDKAPKPEYSVKIDWTCDPARTAELVKRVFQEIDYVRNIALRPNQVALIRESLQRQFETDSQQNGYWLNQIVRRYEDGESENVGAIANVPQRVNALMAEAIQDAARNYLALDRYVKVTLNPDGK